MSESQPLVYIVDDSADYRFLVGQIFKRFLTQYNVQYFESGLALCAHLGTEPVDLPCLILMDHNMPGLSGPQTLTFLKQHSYWESVPAIIISSSTSPQDKQEAYASGAVAYLLKSSTMESLKGQITQLCQYWAEASLLMRKS
jgi:CheY-like chemotaxis protein